jgi:hypothetical protein
LEFIVFGVVLFGPKQIIAVLDVIFYVFWFPQLIMNEIGIIDDLSGSLAIRVINSIVWALLLFWPWRILNRLHRLRRTRISVLAQSQVEELPR